MDIDKRSLQKTYGHPSHCWRTVAPIGAMQGLIDLLGIAIYPLAGQYRDSLDWLFTAPEYVRSVR